MAVDKVFYNQSSESKLGWKPDWFGALYNDEDLILAVKSWQKKMGLVADGMVGPTTYRRIWTEREASISSHQPKSVGYGVSSNNICKDSAYIVHNGAFLPIDWGKVILWDDPNGFKIDKGNYYDYSGEPERNPNVFVNHWDVCLSSESCAKVLNRRGVSVHFCIDNDGTIYQILDTQHGAWHASNVYGNKYGIGVEISNAYYTKYQDWYDKNGFGRRPVCSDSVVHGKKLKEHTDFYPVQIQALKALWKAIHVGLGIPLECPTNTDGSLLKGVSSDVANGRFEGFVNHYNYTKNKIDCANLDMISLIEEVKNSL
tara:strand:- start:255 stop:1196 length:942 start_codon:yes stop_codon:yes gene_type:complete